MQNVVEFCICRWIYSQHNCQALWNSLYIHAHTTNYLRSYKFYKFNTYEYIKHNLISKKGISSWHKIKKEVFGGYVACMGSFRNYVIWRLENKNGRENSI